MRCGKQFERVSIANTFIFLCDCKVKLIWQGVPTATATIKEIIVNSRLNKKNYGDTREYCEKKYAKQNTALVNIPNKQV
jgi:hypothetical protein